MRTVNTMAYIIYGCIVGMILLGLMSFFYTSHSPDMVSKIVDTLGGIVLLVGGAKAGLSLPAPDPTPAPGGTNVTSFVSKEPEATV